MGAEPLQAPDGRVPLPPERITDFDHLTRLFSNWEGNIEQLSRGRFDGTLLVAQGQQLRAYQATFNQAMAARGRDRSGLFEIALVVPENADCVWQGRRLDTGSLVVRRGDVEVDHRTSKQAISLRVNLSRERFRQAARAVLRTDLPGITWLAVQPPPVLFGRMEALFWQFLAAASGSPSSDAHEVHRIEQAFLSAAAEAVVPRPGIVRMERKLPARTALVRRAEEWMRDRLGTPIGEIDLCASLGVRGRTLRLAFRERYGLGPMAYFQTLRLHAARAALKAADPGEASVSEIAGTFGFQHLGKFAGYYRRLFGEVPSDTLARRSGSRRVPARMGP